MKHQLTDDAVKALIVELGYSLNPMSGVDGQYYTADRKNDTIALVMELLRERLENGQVN